MAFYPGDEQYYEAAIRSIKTLKNGQKVAIVKYDGYESEDNESLPFYKLKEKSKRKKERLRDEDEESSSTACSMFSPLKGNEVSYRMQVKYADYMAEEDEIKPVKKKLSEKSSRRLLDAPLPAIRSTKKRKKGIVATGGAAINASKSKTSTLLTAINNSLPSGSVLGNDTDAKDDFETSFSAIQGFDDEDLERPYFAGISNPGAKVPFVLNCTVQPQVQISATINRYLREYQREGVKFLYEHYKNGEGGILGDDMGLGKTIQVIAFLTAILHKTGTHTDCQRRVPEFMLKKSDLDQRGRKDIFLIASPKSVMYNWLDELETWSYCNVGKYHGKDREDTLIKAMKGKLDIVVTTHETLRVSVDDINRVNWSAVIVDEVHKIKEPGSQVTKAFKMLRSKCRYGLTGTALQNNMQELWCVLDWSNPGCLGDYFDFKEEFEDVIMQGQRFDVNKRELASARKKSHEFGKLRDKWLIRRTKALIADQLPTKDEKVVFCNLSDFQTNVYKEVLNSDDMQLVLRQGEDCDCGSYRARGRCCYRRNSENYSIKQIHFIYLAFLIKVANHVALLLPSQSQSKNQKRLSEKICSKVFTRYPQFLQTTRQAAFATLSDPVYCGKMKVLIKLLDICKKDGSKVLLFSYYTKLLDILEQYIQGRGMEYRRIDGKTSGPLRMKYVQEFNRDKFISLCLISTKAGGLGLNMTGANVVIIFDPNWNPAHDQQAQDRAYRIGQQRDVKVYRLISVGTVEENMYLRQIYKQQVASTTIHTESARRYFIAVAGDNRHTGELFGPENIFRLGTQGCLTKDLIEREQTIEHGIKIAKYISGTTSQQQQKKADDSKETMESDCDDGDSNHSDDWISSQLNPEVFDEMESDREKNVNTGAIEDSRNSKTRTQALHEENGSDSDSDSDEIGRDKQKKCDSDANETCLSSGQRNGKLQQQMCDFDKKHTERSVRVQGEEKQLLMIQDKNVSDRKIKQNKQDRDKRNEIRPKRKKELSGLRVDNEKKKGGKYKPNDLSLKGKGKISKRKTQRKDYSTDSSGSEDFISMRVNKETRGKCDEIDDILKECGINYIHSNAKIVGGSKVEEHVSKCAIQDVYIDQQYSQQPANCHIQTFQDDKSEESDDLGASKNPSLSIKMPSSPDTAQSSANQDIFEDLLNPVILHSKRDHYQDGNNTVILGDTPRTIRRQQFSEMASKFGMKSQTEFAKMILSADSSKRRALLTQYYTQKYELSNVEKLFVVKAEVEKIRKGKQDANLKRTSNTEKTIVKKQKHKAKKKLTMIKPVVCDSESDGDGCRDFCYKDFKLSKQTSTKNTDTSLQMKEKDDKRDNDHSQSWITSNTNGESLNRNLENDDDRTKTELPSLHKEENFSFLDGIFLSDNVQEKSDTKHITDKGIATCHPNEAGTLWKRNINYNETLDNTDDSDSSDIFTKYAHTFVANDKYMEDIQDSS
ncbi:DNA excision repair protein ERCC-6-like 2 isoform X2 [Ptychodera flava]